MNLRIALAVGLLPLLMGSGLAQGPTAPLGTGQAQWSRDLEALPPQVRRMRALLLDAARSGEIESFRRPIETNEVPPSLGDRGRERRSSPAMAEVLIRDLKARSPDPHGRALMGGLINMLVVGYARIRVGTAQEMFIWPYFAALSPHRLTPEQWVDVYRVLAPHEVAVWMDKSRYPGWRLGIGPDGTWHYLHGAEPSP